MAAQRFAMNVPHGRVRHCERSDFNVGGGTSGLQLLPKNVYTTTCPFFHPDDKIIQHLQDNQSVHIDLYDQIPVDEYGTPQYSPWSFIAFHTSASKSKRRDSLIEEKLQEVRHLDDLRIREREDMIIATNLPKIEKMKSIMQEQLIDNNMIQTYMQSEWLLIEKSGILESIVYDVEEQKAIKEFFVTNYVEISEMYKSFSAVNSGGCTNTLEYIEFSKFMCETDIFQAGENSNITLKIFIESHLGDDDDNSAASIHSVIRQHEYFVSLIKIATHKFITVPKRELALKRKKGHQASISKASALTQSQAINMLYDQHLKPVIDQLPVGASVKVALGSEETLLFFHEHLDALSHIFCRYAKCSVATAESSMINLKQFSSFVNDADFVGGGNSSSGGGGHDNEATTHDMVTSKDVRQVFSASQTDTVTNEAETRLVEGSDSHDHQEQMVFSEFLEAVARLGVVKYSNVDGNRTYFECIQLAVKKITSLVKRKENLVK